MHLSSVTPPASCCLAARLFFPPMRLLLLSLLLFVLAVPLCAAATTYYVSPSGNDNTNPGTQAAPFKTIQTALNNASTGDTVTLAAGTYTGPGDVDLDTGGRNLTITSTSGDPTTTIIDCGGNATSNPKIVHRAFYFHRNETVVLNGLTIQHCYENTNSDGAVSISKGVTVTLSNCNFTGNTNAGYGDGGGVSSSGTVTLTNCTFSNNTASDGGGVSVVGTVTLTDCTFSGNTASDAGGGVSVIGTVTLTGCTFSNNTAYNGGGGVYGGGTMTLTGCIFSNNTAADGGCFYTDINSNTIQMINCTLGSNAAFEYGGGVYNGGGGTLALSGCTINSNTAASAGGVYTDGSAYNYNSSTTTLMGCILNGNAATNGSGGGIYNDGTVTLTNCLVANNTATNGNGGGVFNSSTANSTANNFNELRFCTIAHNSVSGTNTQGGALENDGTINLIDVILWGNTAPVEAGIGFITADNPVTAAIYCDIQGGFSGMHIIKVDPLFVNPTNLATADFHLKTGTPCVGVGTPISGVTTDLDGTTRANPPTIGCYEGTGTPATVGTTSLAATPSPSIVGQSVTFTVTVKVTSGSPTLAGTVQFKLDGVNLGGAVTLSGSGQATASTSTSSLTVGTHQITAAFTSSNAFSGGASASLSQVVNAPATVSTMTLGSSGTPSLVGQSVTFTATITVTGGSPTLAGTLQFTSDGVNLGSPITVSTSAGHVTVGTATSSLTLGTHRITATYTPTVASNYTGDTSATITQTVTVSSHTHLLWNNADSRVMLWSVDSAGNVQSVTGYGPYTDTYVSSSPSNLWHATALATGADGTSRLLWNNVDHRVMLWDVDSAGNVLSVTGYGPYTDTYVNNSPSNLWSAVGVSVGPDGVTHLLWSNIDHRMMFWDLDAAGNVLGVTGYGPYTDTFVNSSPTNLWDATSLATGPDNVSRVVWNNVDHRVMLWSLNGLGGASVQSVTGFGPYTDTSVNNSPANLWAAQGVSVGPDDVTHLLWSNVDHRMMFWDLDARGNVLGLTGYGPYTDTSVNTNPGNLWSAQAVATGPDNVSHVGWNNADHRVMLWGLNGLGGANVLGVTGYGPYTDTSVSLDPGNLWSLTALSAGP